MSVSSTTGPHPIPTTTPIPTRPPRRFHPRATPKPIINSLPNHTPTDPTTLCPICKDAFTLNESAKILPCTHFYHSHCILPWLQINNSCPVCRFELSSHDEDEDDSLWLDESYVEIVNQHMERVRVRREENERIVNNEFSRDWGVGNVDRRMLVGVDYEDWNVDVGRVNDQDYESWVRGRRNISNSRSRVYVGEDEDGDNTPLS